MAEELYESYEYELNLDPVYLDLLPVYELTDPVHIDPMHPDQNYVLINDLLGQLNNTIFNNIYEDVDLMKKEFFDNSSKYYFKSEKVYDKYIYTTIKGENTSIVINIQKEGVFGVFLVYSQSPLYVKEKIKKKFPTIEYEQQYYIIYYPISDKYLEKLYT